MDKERLLQVYLQQQTAPKITEANGQDWILYGDGEYKNLYPQFLIDIYNSSATHSAIVNATSAMISGKEIVIEDQGNNLGSYQFVTIDINGEETFDWYWYNEQGDLVALSDLQFRDTVFESLINKHSLIFNLNNQSRSIEINLVIICL